MLKIGPAITRNIAVERDVAIPAPDNARLLTDLYLAGQKSPRPVILLRSPYGRGGVYGTMARLFAERGYHAVVQSTRGTFGSEGRIDFDREAADGRSAADWIVDQPWSNGVLGTFGLPRGTGLARELEHISSHPIAPSAELADKLASMAEELRSIIESRK